MDVTEEEEAQHLLRTMSDVEIQEAADQGDPAADYIVNWIWDLEKRTDVAKRTDQKRRAREEKEYRAQAIINRYI